MQVRETIERKLAGALPLRHLELENESRNHSVPPGSETHFKAVLVSDAFEGKGLVDRHQMVYRLLAEEMAGGVHALALHTYTAAEWEKRSGGAPMSPPCLGGSKQDRS
ncbi:MAG: BolA/IbaG family iron-sulfur metabolism protein [Candidatus Methylomirabilis sp.]|nr:BolA/IbaG family iron-sulfur metabolism protein [Deltaproteobacteria bacterium]